MKPITLEHFTEYRFPSMLRSNQKGATSFVTKKANLDKNSYEKDLWLLENAKVRQLTFSGDVGAAFWKDSETLIFPRIQKNEDKATVEKGVPLTVLQSLSIHESGEAQEFLRLDYSVTDIDFLPDGRFLFLAIYDADFEAALLKCDQDAEKAAKFVEEDGKILETLTELPFWENGGGFTARNRQRLYLYDNGVISPLVDELTNVLQLRLAPDFSCAYYIAQSYKHKAPITDTLFQLNLSTLEKKDISVEKSFAHSHCIPLENNCAVVFGSNMKSYGLNQSGGFYHLNLSTGEHKKLYDGHEYEGWDAIGSDLKMPSAPVWFAHRETVYWVAQKDQSSCLFSIHAKTGEIHTLSKQEGSVSELVFDGRDILFTFMHKTNGPELYSHSLDSFVEKQISHLNDFSSQYSFSVPQPIAFANQEEHIVHGWVMKPVNFTEGEEYPAILVIHGGPKTAYGSVLMHEMQYWANQGYGVFFCNPTGSSGQGDEFGDLRERYGLIDFDDLMLFVDIVLEQNPWIDSELLGVTGGSYGGFMTNWIIGHTNRFKAAASERSIANWATMQTVSDIGYYFVPDQNGATMWNDAESVWEQSPLKYASNVKTPTLFVHSTEDYRCPEVEGIQMYSALQYFDIETKLCLFKGENHDLTRSGSPKSRLRRLQEITEWFDSHLKI